MMSLEELGINSKAVASTMLLSTCSIQLSIPKKELRVLGLVKRHARSRIASALQDSLLAVLEVLLLHTALDMILTT